MKNTSTLRKIATVVGFAAAPSLAWWFISQDFNHMFSSWENRGFWLYTTASLTACGFAVQHWVE